MELKTLQYFSHNLTDPIHEVFQVLGNPNHSEYNKLLHDMKSVSYTHLKLLVSSLWNYGFLLMKLQFLTDGTLVSSSGNLS